MAISKINKVLLKSKFRGCLLGSLVGDCCGAPFEGDTFSTGAKLVLQKYFDTLEGQYFKAPVKKYTEDSSMTKCVAQCLLDAPTQLDPTVFAKSLTKEFFTDPRRGYGENLIVVFNKLRANKFEDPFKPARETANYSTSSDNGAAMRISPVALMYCSDYKRMIESAKSTTEITHTHREGVIGSLLQCAAIQQSLLIDPSTKLDVINYSNQLIDKVTELEKDDDSLTKSETSFRVQLENVRDLLTKKTAASDEEVLNMLGHSTRAMYSVPTAIYCFLRAMSDITEVNTNNPFRRTLQYAISLGGDTDTIASMAGSIAGAYHGQELLSESLLRHCENSEHFTKLADGLFKISIT